MQGKKHYQEKLFVRLSLIAAVALVTTLSGCENDISDADRAFMKLAGSAGLMEVQMGQLAMQKSSNPKIVYFAGKMVDEHTRFNEEFLRLLKKIHENLPVEMNEQHRRMVEDLSRLHGKEFEKKYVDDMVADHTYAVEAFKNALARAQNYDYKKFLQNGTTIVEKHSEMAQRLKDEMGQ